MQSNVSQISDQPGPVIRCSELLRTSPNDFTAFTTKSGAGKLKSHETAWQPHQNPTRVLSELGTPPVPHQYPNRTPPVRSANPVTEYIKKYADRMPYTGLYPQLALPRDDTPSPPAVRMRRIASALEHEIQEDTRRSHPFTSNHFFSHVRCFTTSDSIPCRGISLLSPGPYNSLLHTLIPHPTFSPVFTSTTTPPTPDNSYSDYPPQDYPPTRLNPNDATRRETGIENNLFQEGDQT
eukprot:85508-Hanusia_phi.AAC.3